MKIEFTAYPRTVQGTGASRRLRHAGKVPGIVYGTDEKAQPIELDHRALYQHLRLEAFHASILEMKLEGKAQPVLLRDFQMHPWKKEVLHIDFQRVDKNRKIHMKVPLHFLNAESAPGVKTEGGMVSHLMNEIHVQCLPDDLPEFIAIDLGSMGIGDSVHVLDIKYPSGVEPVSRLAKDNPIVVAVVVTKEAVIEEVAVEAPVTEIIAQKPAEPGAEGAEKKDEKKDGGKKDEKKEGGKKE
jgi:large subunit ribosomal protein L25